MSDNTKPTSITSVLHETRVFSPPKQFSRHAHVKSLAQYRRLYNESIRAPDRFWAKQAKNELIWFKPWKKVLQWKEPFAKWFVGGQLNVSANCLDRWLDTPTANTAALIWEGEPATEGKPGEERVLTYRQLHREVCRFANVLKRKGHRFAPRKQRSPHHRRARRLVASRVGIRGRPVSAGEDGQRSAAVHSVHQWLDREAQRNSPHDRRISAGRETHDEIRFRPA